MKLNVRELSARRVCPAPFRSLFCKYFSLYSRNSYLSGAVVAERYVT